MNTPILELIHVTMRLGEELVLKDISLKIFAGETIVLIGQSGSGKTVLLKTLAGVYEPTEGMSLCHGHAWSQLSVMGKHELSKAIGMQFQKGALFDNLTAQENVMFPILEHTTVSETQAKEMALDCLRKVDLEKAAGMMPHDMSGGMRQRLGIARALALKPELLFLDDPTAGLDPVNTEKMVDLILELKNDINATLVMVTHSVSVAYQAADRIFLIADQTAIETGNAEQTKNHPDPRVQQFIQGRLDGPLKPT